MDYHGVIKKMLRKDPTCWPRAYHVRYDGDTEDCKYEKPDVLRPCEQPAPKHWRFFIGKAEGATPISSLEEDVERRAHFKQPPRKKRKGED